jgi:hypothetical protein
MAFVLVCLTFENQSMRRLIFISALCSTVLPSNLHNDSRRNMYTPTGFLEYGNARSSSILAKND